MIWFQLKRIHKSIRLLNIYRYIFSLYIFIEINIRIYFYLKKIILEDNVIFFREKTKKTKALPC